MTKESKKIKVVDLNGRPLTKRVKLGSKNLMKESQKDKEIAEICTNLVIGEIGVGEGVKRIRQEILESLPEEKELREDEKGSYGDGWNDCLEAIKEKLNDKD